LGDGILLFLGDGILLFLGDGILLFFNDFESIIDLFWGLFYPDC